MSTGQTLMNQILLSPFDPGRFYNHSNHDSETKEEKSMKSNDSDILQGPPDGDSRELEDTKLEKDSNSINNTPKEINETEEEDRSGGMTQGSGSDSTSKVLLIVSIVGMVIVAILLVYGVSQVNEKVTIVIDTVGDGLKQFGEIADGVLDTVKTYMEKAGTNIASATEGIAEQIAYGLTTMMSYISSIAGGIIDALGTFIDTVRSLLRDVSSTIMNFFNTAIQPIIELLTSAVGTIISAIRSVLGG